MLLSETVPTQTNPDRPAPDNALLIEYEQLRKDFFMFDPEMISVDEELRRHDRIVQLHSILFPGEVLTLSPIA